MDALPTEGLPPGWGAASLETICDINPPTNTSDLSGDTAITFVPMAAVGALTNMVDTNTTRPLREITSGFTRFRTGDVIFAKITPCMENGKIALVPELPHGIGIGSTEFHVVRPKPGIDAAYVCHYLMQESFRATARRSMSGAVGQQRVPAVFLREAVIPIPPTAEQARIVAAVNALFDEVEAGEAALAQAREGLTQFRASLLHAACTGALTADWRAANVRGGTGSDLLARILRTRGEQERRRPERLSISQAGTLPTVPASWTWCTLGDLGPVGSGTTPARGRAEFWSDGDVPWVTSAAVNARTITQASAYVSQRALQETSLRVYQPGTIVVALYGEGSTRGKAAELAISATTNQALAAVGTAALAPATRAYVMLCLEAAYLRLRSAAIGGVQPNLTLGLLREWPIPLPPIDEQEAILSAVGSTEIGRNLIPEVGASQLRQSILHATFTGRLVPQDPTDERAAALLARLRATPAAARRPRARRTATQPDLIETPA